MQLGSILLDRLLDPRLLHVVLASDSIQSEFLECAKQLADSKRIRSCFSSLFFKRHRHLFFSDFHAEHTVMFNHNFDLQSFFSDVGLLDYCRKQLVLAIDKEHFFPQLSEHRAVAV